MKNHDLLNMIREHHREGTLHEWYDTLTHQERVDAIRVMFDELEEQ